MNYLQFKAYFLTVGIGIFTFKLNSVEYCLHRTINIKRGMVTRGKGYSFEYGNNKIYFPDEISLIKEVTFDGKTIEDAFDLFEDIYINEMTEEEFIQFYCNLDFHLLDNIAEFNLGKFERFDTIKEYLNNNEKEGNLLLLVGDSELEGLDIRKPSNYYIHYMGRILRICIDEMKSNILFLDYDDKVDFSHYKYGRIKDHFKDKRIDNEKYRDLQTLLKYQYSKKWKFVLTSFFIMFLASIVLVANELFFYAIIPFVLSILIIIIGSKYAGKTNKHISQLKSRLYKNIPFSFSKYQNDFLNGSCEGFIDTLESIYGKCEGGTPCAEDDTVDLLLYFRNFSIFIYYMSGHASLVVEDKDENELINKKYRYIDYDDVDAIEKNMLDEIWKNVNPQLYSGAKKH